MATYGDLNAATCSCGKTCKNATDLKIHQTKMGCRQDEQRSLQCEVERKAYQEVAEPGEIPQRSEHLCSVTSSTRYEDHQRMHQMAKNE